MKRKIKTLRSRLVYTNPWIQVKEYDVRERGIKKMYGIVETPPSVYIIAMTPKQEIYLVGQYRYQTKTYSWELPGGGSAGKTLLRAAKDELQEETGLVAKQWKKIGSFQCMNGFCSEWGHVFLATSLVQTGKNKQAEDGITKMRKVLFQKVLAMVSDETITDSLTITALTKTAFSLRKFSRRRSRRGSSTGSG